MGEVNTLICLSSVTQSLLFPGSGDHDMCVPFTGSQAWTRSLGYKVIDEWRAWTFDGQVAGYVIPVSFA